jgi:DNA mismatch endonuclease (patch repair protein)
MSAIRSKNTRPKLVVRRLVHAMGFRFRLHRSDLPGKPDLVFPRLRRVILVHGCYWHMHRCRYGRVVAKTNEEFWRTKRASNVTRDRRNLRELRRAGWSPLVVWECWIRDGSALQQRIEQFLRGEQEA